MNLLHGDCLELMKEIPDNSIDMVLCDPPYGTTACKWDSVIPFEPMWTQLKRITKDNGAICLFGSEPFSSHLRLSNLKMFKYDWIWDKVNKYTGALNANRMPMKRHEIISIFYKRLPAYIKQYREGKPYETTKNTGHGQHTVYGKVEELRHTVNKGKHNPCSILEIKGDLKKELGLHPTQKPVSLLEYLVKTYTLEDETVLDFTMGSGSTGVACKNLNRKFIGIEKDKYYFLIAHARIHENEKMLQELLEANKANKASK